MEKMYVLAEMTCKPGQLLKDSKLLCIVKNEDVEPGEFYDYCSYDEEAFDGSNFLSTEKVSSYSEACDRAHEYGEDIWFIASNKIDKEFLKLAIDCSIRWNDTTIAEVVLKDNEYIIVPLRYDTHIIEANAKKYYAKLKHLTNTDEINITFIDRTAQNKVDHLAINKSGESLPDIFLATGPNNLHEYFEYRLKLENIDMDILDYMKAGE